MSSWEAYCPSTHGPPSSPVPPHMAPTPLMVQRRGLCTVLRETDRRSCHRCAGQCPGGGPHPKGAFLLLRGTAFALPGQARPLDCGVSRSGEGRNESRSLHHSARLQGE